MTDTTEIMRERDAWKARALLAEKHRAENQRGWVEAQADVERLRPSIKIALDYQRHIDATVALAKELGCDCGSFETRLAWIRARALEGTELRRANDAIGWQQRAERAEAVICEARAMAYAAPELNMCNYDHEQVRQLNDAMCELFTHLDAAKGGAK